VVEGTNHTVTGNTLQNCEVGILQQRNPSNYPGDADQSNVADQYFGRGNSPMTCGNTISGNTFNSNGTDTRNIGVGGGIVTNTNTGETFCSIQSAIDDAQTIAGHTITVSAGTYNEEITVNKRLTIIGAGSGSNPATNTVIQGSTLNIPVVKIRTGGLNVSDRATIKDVYVTTSASNTLSWIGGIEIDASNNNPLGHITLENVTVANCLGKTTGVHFKGVSATGVSTDIISDVKIINSLITNNQYGISARHTQVHGLEILGGSGRTVISENRRAGMLIYGVDNGSGFSNQFDDFVFNKVDFNHNNTSGDLDAGNGDIFFLGFNGDLNVDDVVITMGNTAVASPYYIGFGINGKYLGGTEPAGNMTFKNMQLNDYSGAQQHPRALMGIWTFSNLNAGVELDGVEFNGTGASQGALSLSGLYGTTPLVIKNSKFAGLSSYVVAPANQITDIRSVGSYVPVDATNNNTFTGTSDNYDIEDRIIHKIDNASYGLVTWVATHCYVTPNSYLPNITTSPDVQRGVGAASNGDIVHIEAGVYTGNVDATSKTVTLSPGASPGCVTINGNVSLNGGDIMYIEANNTNACTDYDQFIINGSVSLGGATLDLTLGYTPALGDSYTIINNDASDAVVGQFAQGAAITVSGYTFSINYAGGDGNDVVLTRCSGGVQNINTGEIFCTIQSAIDDAQTLAGHTITVSAGTYNEDVNVTKSVTISGADATTTIVNGPKGGGNATFRVSAFGVIIENFTITRDGNNTTDWNDPTLNSAGVAIQSQGNTATIRHNIITGNRTGIDVNNSNGNTITGNTIDFNRTGLLFRNQTDNTNMTNNFIRDNWTVGVLFIDASGGSNSPLQQALNSNFNDNNISGNWYGDIVDRQNGGSLPPPGSNMKNFECNWYGVTSPVVSIVNSAEPGYASQIPVAYGGTATNPGSAPNILGPASANFDYISWLTNGTDDQPSTQGFQPVSGSCSGTPVDITSATPDDIICGETTGSINVSWAGGTSPYDIAWTGGSATGVTSPYIITGLAAGTYGITVTDANGSTDTDNATINYYPITNLTQNTTFADIQPAVNAANDGDVIEICAGTFALSAPVTITKKITLQGQGTLSSIVELSSSWFNVNGVDAFFCNSSDVTIQNIHFKVVGKGQGNLVSIYHSNTQILNNKFSGEYVFGDPEVTRATVWSANPMTGIVMDGNIIESLRQPGYLSNGSGTISNNTVNNTRGWVIEGVGTLSYTGNIFGTNTSHITILNTASNISGLTISNNDLSGTVTDWAIDNRTTGTASAECNWYGTTSSSGVASKITGNVDYTPWLTNGTDNAPALGFQPVPGACTGTPVVISSTTPSAASCVNNDGQIAVVLAGGTASYTIAWSGPATGSATSGNVNYTISGLAAGAYNITVTDANGSTATTATVTVGYHPVTNLTTLATYATIQGAVTVATAGDVIEICNGTYNERVTIDKSLTLQGQSEAGVILDGTGLSGTGSGIKINSNVTSVTIQKMTIQNYTGSTPNGSAGIYANGSNDGFTADHLTVKNNVSASGIYANGPVDGFEVTNSTVSGHGPGARGIVIWNGFKQNITISNNAVSNNNCCGIELQDGSASGVTISDNILLGNGDNGISVVGLTSGAGANVISGNFLQDNGRFGIEIKNPMGTGLDNGDGSIVVENNTVELTALYVLGSPELRDRAGIAVFRRSPIFSDGNPNMPQGVIVRNNTVEGYKQPSNSEGFGIVAEGQGHIITNNTLNRNDVGLQFQMGHTPYTGSGGIPDAGDQSNIADQYFGRGNAPQSCGLVDGGQTNGSGLLANGTDFRIVGFGANFVQLNGRKVENTNTGMAYCSIQQAIDDNPTLNGHTIEVSAGTYVENVVVGKSVSILGPNATIDPCTGTRGAEAIVVPSTSAISSGEIFHVAASNVTIAGLTIDGDNTLISSGFSSTNGADIDAAEGITVYENNISNLTVQNNFIQNLSYFGVSLFGANYSAPETHGHVVSNNLIRNMGTYDALSGIANWGGGILLYNSQYSHVYENCIENARIGIQTGNFQKVNSGSTDFQLIENNTIEARALGIFYNLHNYSPFTIKDNTITALFNSDELPASTKSWKGLLIASLGNNMGLSNIVNNSVDGIGLTNAWTRGSEGINVWNVTNTARPIITEGTLTNVDKGIFVNNFEGYNSDGSYGSYADISKVTVSNADEGIVVYDSPNSTSHSSVNATAINNYISADTGIRLGETASGTVNGTFNENHITGFTTYAINSTVSNTVDATCNWYGTTSSNAIAAAITGTVNYILWLTSGTDDQPSTSGFQPLPTACSGTPVEITSTTPSPETCTHDNGSIAIVYSGGTADYTIAWSGPESGSDMTSANSYTIPTLVAGNYVITITDVNGSSVTTTVAVEYHPVTNQTTSSTYATIQAAIDAATAGDEIDVCAGTYVEHIKIDKAISLLGPNATIDACGGTRVPEAIIYPPVSDIAYNTDDGALIDVQASNVTISGFLLNGDNPDITTGFTSTNGADIDAASGIVRYSTGDNLVVTNNIIQNLSYFGVTLYDYPAGVPSAGNIIANNKIQDLGTYDAGSGIDYWGGGVLLYNNQYTYVHDNCMTNVRTGIQTGNYSKANPGTTNDQLITNNIMAVRRRGIFHNLAYSNASAYTLSNNTITGLMDSHETVWDGILLSSLSVLSTTSNNSINGAGITNPSEGIEVWNVKNNAPAAISGGNISGVSTGIFVNNYEGYSSNGADGAHTAVNGVTINATNIGVYLHDHPSSTHGQVSGSFNGCAITANEGIRTVESSSGATNGSFTGNTINADSLGINLTGMLLSSSNGLTIDDNTITLSDQIENTQPTVGIQLANLAGTAAATITNNDISGALYGYAGYNINTTPVSTIDGGTVSGIMQGISIINTDGVLTKGSSINVKDVIMNGFTGTSSNPAINFHAGVYTFTTAGTTIAEGITMNIEGVTIDGTGKPSQASGGIYLADFSGGSTNVQTITVYNSTIQNNANRGFDARGKVNLALTANTISNNGHDAWGAGGNYGFSIIAQKEATITAYNNFISLPASSTTEVYGLFTGNGTTNSITAHDNSILLNGNANSGSRLASSSAGTGSIDATCNWWGTVVVNDLASMISGNVTYTPWLINGTDDQLGTPGFQPVSGACSGIPIAVTVDGVIDALCTTGVNGTISITVTGGISPYTYLWSDGQTTEDAVNLAAGVYTVTVTDIFGNTGTASATVGASPVVNTTTMTGYSTIQGAINATNTVNGNTIVVCAGTYNENVVVNKELTINGAKAGVDPRPSTSSTRVIDDASESIVIAPKNKNIFKIESNNVTINGFEAKHSGGSGTADAFKASNSQTNIQILNNIVYQSTDEGIQLEGGTDYLVQYNYVKNPVGDGITFSSYSGTTPTNQPGTNLKIKDNDIEGSTSAYGSVYLYGVRNVTVSGNMITTRSSGIIVGSDGLPVSNALIHNNTINTEMHSAYSAYAMGIGIDGNGDNIQIHNNYIDDIGDGDLVHSNAYPDNFGLIYVGPSANANPTNVTVNNNYLYRFVDHNYLFVKGSVTKSD
jgi:hypothetical protein